MSGWFNPASMSPNMAAQLRFSLALHAQSHMSQASQALQQIRALDQMGGAQPFQQFGQCGVPPQCGCMPSPQVQLSGAPAGRGLSKNPQGWPQGSVRTAGGYTIVPEGKDAAWSIYGPTQKPGEKPNTRVWGDPHVSEKDGTRWDFTKNSDFMLPDGTRIAANTTSQTGQSVSKSLEITNGADRVNITGIDRNCPHTGEIKADGYERRAARIASNPTRDTFRLGGDSKSVKWFKESGGVQQGLVTGARYDGKTQTYQQCLNKYEKYCVDPNMRAPFGSAAWGNQLRSELVDHVSQLPLSNAQKQQFAQYMSMDHILSDFAMQGFSPFGGCGGQFGNWNQACGCVGSMGDLMLMSQMANMQRSGYLAHRMYC